MIAIVYCVCWIVLSLEHCLLLPGVGECSPADYARRYNVLGYEYLIYPGLLPVMWAEKGEKYSGIPSRKVFAS